MEKPLIKQASMCDMMPDAKKPPRTMEETDQCVRKSCLTHDICGAPLKPAIDLYPFVQWQNHNEDTLKRSAQGHHQSNVVEYNVQRAVNTLSGSVDKCMLDSTNKIAGTARNIDRWREDMYQILECVRREIDLLMCSRNRTLKAQMALRIICSISTECLDRRAFRLHMDLTEDPGQIELIKEKELITEVGDLMCRTLNQLDEQLNRNKRMKYQLEENWSNKNQSFEIDALNLGLNIQSPVIMSHQNVIKDSESSCLSVSEWEAATNDLHHRAKDVVDESACLRSMVDDYVLKKNAKKLRDQADAVDIALARFICDTQQVNQCIENDLRQVVNRLGDSEKLIEDLLRVLSNLEKAKKTAETRLHNRLKRPKEENCEDSAQLSLISEVKNLEEQLKTLNYQLDCARTGHLGLQEARLQLEDEARIKRKTLWIDCIRCQTVRAHYPSLNVLIGH